LSRSDADGVNRQLQRLAREHHGRNTQALQPPQKASIAYEQL
jgi:hypothetical protein